MEIESSLTSSTEVVSDLFAAGKFYRIPEYQRPFSWNEDQFQDLVLDLKNSDRSRPYFLGTMVLHEDGPQLNIVDGQQRVTSLMILLACLRDLIEDEGFKQNLQQKIVQPENQLDGIPSRVRLDVREHATFESVVVEEGGTSHDFDLRDYAEPERRYFSACEVFKSSLDDLSQAELRDYAQYLSQGCCLIALTADSFEQAFRLFEIVNDRGKQLRRIDILKSKTISPVNIANDAIRNRVATRWHDLENELGEDAFESVFFSIRYILTRDKPQGDLLKEFERRIFAPVGQRPAIIQPGQPFAELLFSYADLYREIFIDRSYLNENTLEHRKFRALFEIMASEFKASEWRACVLSFAKKFGRDRLFDFIYAIEALFLTHWVTSVRKDERYADYSAVLNLIQLSDAPEAVIAGVPSNLETISQAVRRSDFYQSGYAKYFLLRLELLAAEHDQQRSFSAKSIEHVFPQNPPEDSIWLAGLSAEEMETFVHKIGNLVLISRSKNSSASNRPFGQKKTSYLRERVSDYPRSIQVLQYDQWDRAVIEERTLEAAGIVMSHL